MKVLFFDTETTGLSPKGGYANGSYYRGQICQLSYIIDDGEIRLAKNFYFSVDHVEYGASKVNGLNEILLQQLSGGREFCDDAVEIAEDFAEADVIIAHNFSFDCKFMQEEFGRLNRDFRYKRAVCSMRATTPLLKLPGIRSPYKYPSLEELAHHSGVAEQDIIKETVRLFGESSSAHDARYDTVKLMLAFQKACCLWEELAAALAENN